MSAPDEYLPDPPLDSNLGNRDLGNRDAEATDSLEPKSNDRKKSYTVIARRYRPQTFADLIGQQHVGRALAGAIETDRVGHAYLFTGARGVGKTSAARIFAKALNCTDGPSPVPCNQCDICHSISHGSDVDVLEIDGASNRGVDEIRQLRQNVGVRPSRARMKIYIIDEVHMLTREAFNALLKTLEEPPSHVKFIFCTTEPGKIPITIHSRCQRFDFAGVQSSSIVDRLRQICDNEGVSTEDEALEIIARRAAGSMRDSQSLLEQALSFGGKNITAKDVHAMLGTAGAALLENIVADLAARDAAGALSQLDRAITDGVDPGQLLEQLMGYLRDCAVAGLDCPADILLSTTPAQMDGLRETSEQIGLETLLAILQILDHTLSRMRLSTQTRILAEMALVRICHLEDFREIADLISQLDATDATKPNSGIKKKREPIRHQPADPQRASDRSDIKPSPGTRTDNRSAPSPVMSSSVMSPAESSAVALASEPSAAIQTETKAETAISSASSPLATQTVSLTEENASAIWEQAIGQINDMDSAQASLYQEVTISESDRLVVRFPAKYNSCKPQLERSDKREKFQRVLASIVGAPVRLVFEVLPADTPATISKSSVSQQDSSEKVNTPQIKTQPTNAREMLHEKSKDPLVQRAMELFDAIPTRVVEPDKS